MTARKKPVTKLAIGLTTTLVLVAGGLGAAAWMRGPASESSDTHPATYATAPVVRGSVSIETQAPGTLTFAGQRTLGSGLAGVVTQLPEAGAQMGAGSVLYAVNTRPVALLHGTTPAWRDFQAGMTAGPDVQQLEANLAALGLFTGDVDPTFTALTAAGISAWQKALGQEQTGVLERASIVFADGDVRIAGVTSTVGASVGEATDLLTISADEKVVNVELALGDQGLAVVGAAVTVLLPDGTATAGTVSSVGVPTEKAPGGDGTTLVVIPVGISLDDQSAAAGFQRASVNVRFSTVQADDVLTVPVEALIALDDSTFGVEVLTTSSTTSSTTTTNTSATNSTKTNSTKRIPVKTGLFAAGRVEISADGIAEGVNVLVPKR